MTDATVSVRAATRADREALAAWLQARHPLPAIARRGRDEALCRLLDRPELGLCLLAQAGGAWSACMPVHLLPRLDLGGLAVLAAEWWSGSVAEPAYRALLLAACRNWLADWCRAHGVRHLLLAPALAPAPDDADAAMVQPLPDGLWHRDLAPAAKVLR
ncbi:hypothetical protein [Cupriavidus sp. AU9028]|uniref:hypothetical protein n=1 Tax=Cupriavidus sp. AU9028 TaxID=2871157 RepID=UPI001C9455F4|nr:hypothetical protein [Cupriavidus sp. AU9028]MBY4897672.1 hypothetical protein [Cupriavidus sp. AU9028]